MILWKLTNWKNVWIIMFEQGNANIHYSNCSNINILLWKYESNIWSGFHLIEINIPKSKPVLHFWTNSVKANNKPTFSISFNKIYRRKVKSKQRDMHFNFLELLLFLTTRFTDLVCLFCDSHDFHKSTWQVIHRMIYISLMSFQAYIIRDNFFGDRGNFRTNQWLLQSKHCL